MVKLRSLTTKLKTVKTLKWDNFDILLADCEQVATPAKDFTAAGGALAAPGAAVQVNAAAGGQQIAPGTMAAQVPVAGNGQQIAPVAMTAQVPVVCDAQGIGYPQSRVLARNPLCPINSQESFTHHRKKSTLGMQSGIWSHCRYGF